MPHRLTHPKGYFGLMERMAAALGMDILRDAEALGLSEADIERLMQRCAGCWEPQDCRRLLRLPDGAPLPPKYCTNRKLLRFLAARSRTDDSAR